MKTFYSSILLIYTKQVVKNTPAIFITQQAAAGSFGVRHHAKDIPLFIADACNIMDSAIGISTCIHIPFFITIPVNDLPVHLQLFQRGIIGKISSLTMRYRDPERSRSIFSVAF